MSVHIHAQILKERIKKGGEIQTEKRGLNASMSVSRALRVDASLNTIMHFLWLHYFSINIIYTRYICAVLEEEVPIWLLITRKL